MESRRIGSDAAALLYKTSFYLALAIWENPKPLVVEYFGVRNCMGNVNWCRNVGLSDGITITIIERSYCILRLFLSVAWKPK